MSFGKRFRKQRIVPGVEAEIGDKATHIANASQATVGAIMSESRDLGLTHVLLLVMWIDEHGRRQMLPTFAGDIEGVSAMALTLREVADSLDGGDYDLAVQGGSKGGEA